MNSSPKIEVIFDKINSLINNQETRSSIADWAFSIINNDSIQIDNKIILEILTSLGAVDLTVDDSNFLYEIEDFKTWKNKLLQIDYLEE